MLLDSCMNNPSNRTMSHQIRRNTTSFFPNGGVERRNSVKPTVPQAGNATEGQTDNLLANDKYEEDSVFGDNKRQSSIISNSTNQN